jgi:hypothetical protein
MQAPRQRLILFHPLDPVGNKHHAQHKDCRTASANGQGISAPNDICDSPGNRDAKRIKGNHYLVH